MRARPFIRQRARSDGNARGIIAALEAAGCSVIDARWPLDLICGLAGETFWVEIKDPGTRYGRAGFNEAQNKFFESWRGGPAYIVTEASYVPTLVLEIRRRAKARKAA